MVFSSFLVFSYDICLNFFLKEGSNYRQKVYLSVLAGNFPTLDENLTSFFVLRNKNVTAPAHKKSKLQ